MAIRAPHLAFGNLIRQGFPGDTGLNECADVRLLVAKMVEVQDPRIRFAAVHTWMTEEVFAHPSLEVSRCAAAPLFGVRDLSFSVARVPLVGVIALTEKADPLSRLALQRPVRELDEGLGLAADSTSSYSERCLKS